MRTFPSQSRAYVAGLFAAWISVFCPVIGGTYVGLGALAHDLGFSLGWMAISTVVIWAGPAQLVLMSALASGAAPVEIAVGVSLTGVRLLPMLVALLPLLRPGARSGRDFLLPMHFTSISMWVESLRLLPAVAPQFRVAMCNGLASGFMVMALLCAAVGFHLAAGLPLVLAAALSALTPMSFLMSSARNARQLIDVLAFIFGVVLGPLLAWYHLELDLMWSGLIGGVAAYAIHRLREALR